MKAALYALIGVVVLGIGVFAYEQHQALVQAQQTASQSQHALQERLDEKPALPVSVTFQRHPLFRTMGAIFWNDSPKELEIVLDCSNPTTGQSKEIDVNLTPHGRTQVFPRLWNFHSGDRLHIRNADYSSKEIIVP